MKRKFTSACAIFLLLMICVPSKTTLASPRYETERGSTTTSSSWTSNADQSIYGGVYKPVESDVKDDKKPKKGEKELSSLIRNAGTSIEVLLYKAGLDLDSTVYGRVNGQAKGGVNNASFELKSHNIYGLVGAYIYGILRGMVYAGLSMVFVAMLVRAGCSSSTKAYEKFRTNIGNFLLIFMLITLMPKLVDVGLYTRDVFLYGTSKINDLPILGGRDIFNDEVVLDGNNYTRANYDQAQKDYWYWIGKNAVGNRGGVYYSSPVYDLQTSKKVMEEYKHYEALGKEMEGRRGISGTYYAMAADTEKFIPAAMYCSIQILSLYIVFSYISTALCAMLAFAFFPVITILFFMDRKLLDHWVKTMVSFALVPVVDAVLLVVPIVSWALGAPIVVSFIICMAIMPSRAFLKSLLGIGGSFGAELAGVGAMMMLGRLAGSAVRGATGLGKGIGQSMQDMRNSKMFESLSGIEKPEMAMAGAGYGGKRMSEEDSQKLLAYNQQRSEAMSGFANYKNFDDPVFKDALSDSDRSKYYRQRSVVMAGSSIGRAAGGVAGAGFGMATSAFSGLSGKALAMSAGGAIGGILGSGAGRGIGTLAGNGDIASSDSSGISFGGGSAGIIDFNASPLTTETATAFEEPVSDPAAVPLSPQAGNSPAEYVRLFSGKDQLSPRMRDEFEAKAEGAMKEFLGGNTNNGMGNLFIEEMGVSPKGTDERAMAAAVEEARTMYEKLGKTRKTEVASHLNMRAVKEEYSRNYPNWDETEKARFDTIYKNLCDRARQMGESVIVKQ